MQGDSLQRWAFLQSRLKKARAEILKQHGENELHLHFLELDATHDMNGVLEVETEFGKVCKILEYAGDDVPPVVTGLKFVPSKKESTNG